MKTSICRDGTLQKQTKLDGNDITILSYHPYILCYFTNYALCLLFVCICRRAMEGSGVGSAA